MLSRPLSYDMAGIALPVSPPSGSLDDNPNNNTNHQKSKKYAYPHACTENISQQTTSLHDKHHHDECGWN